MICQNLAKIKLLQWQNHAIHADNGKPNVMSNQKQSPHLPQPLPHQRQPLPPPLPLLLPPLQPQLPPLSVLNRQLQLGFNVIKNFQFQKFKIFKISKISKFFKFSIFTILKPKISTRCWLFRCSKRCYDYEFMDLSKLRPASYQFCALGGQPSSCLEQQEF